MRVLVAHNRYSSAQPSGENRVVDTEIDQLRAAGVEVVTYLRSSDEIADLRPGQRLQLAVSPIYAARSQRDLRGLLRRHRPDIVHLHNPYPLLSAWVVRTAHAAGVPVVHTVHNYRHVCVNGIHFRDGHPCTDCAGRRLPLPAAIHGCYRGSRPQSVVMATALAAHRTTWRSVDRYLALTEIVAEHLRGYGIPDDRIVVRPNSVTDPGPPDPPGDGFLFLGRLTRDKGVDLLLRAWLRHPDGALGPLRVGGDGPLRSQLAAADRADVGYLGALDDGGVRDAVRASAVVVVPSQWPDVLPTVILEALAAGRPVLGTAVGGIPYAIGDAGWTVSPSIDALAAALPLARSEAVGRSNAARRRYETTFHPDVAVPRLLEIYASTIATYAARESRT